MTIRESVTAAACLMLIATGCADNSQRNAHYVDYPFFSTPASGAAVTAEAQPSGNSGQSSGTSNVQAGQAITSSSANSPDFTADENALIVQIRRQLIQDPVTALYVPNLQITADGGAVTLKGNVNNEQDKQNVESLARRVVGVTSVDNELETSSTQAAANTSGQGNTEENKNVQNAENSVAQSTSNESAGNSTQNATSSGALSATSRPNESSGAAQSEPVGGVTVTVQGSNSSDQALAQQISQELRTDTSLAAAISTIQVALQDGKVTLSGSVQNDQQKHDIESAIQRVTGVSSVENQIQVKSAQ